MYETLTTNFVGVRLTIWTLFFLKVKDKYLNYILDLHNKTNISCLLTKTVDENDLNSTHELRPRSFCSKTYINLGKLKTHMVSLTCLS